MLRNQLEDVTIYEELNVNRGEKVLRLSVHPALLTVHPFGADWPIPAYQFGLGVEIRAMRAVCAIIVNTSSNAILWVKKRRPSDR